MSIHTLRQKMADVPGAHELIMRYEDGGRTHAYSFGSVVVRVDAPASEDEIKAAIVAALKSGPAEP